MLDLYDPAEIADCDDDAPEGEADQGSRCEPDDLDYGFGEGDSQQD